MKPLFTGNYCPNDCDRKKEEKKLYENIIQIYCPNCFSSRIQSFSMPGYLFTMECLACGRMW